MSDNAQPIVFSKKLLLGIFVAAVLVLIGIGYWYYQHEAARIKEDEYMELATIASLKARQISDWRKERQADAIVCSTGLIRQVALEWLRNPQDDSARETLLEQMKVYHDYYNFWDLLLIDKQGQLRITLLDQSTELDPEAAALVAETMETGETSFGQFYLSKIHQHPHLDLVAPILDEQGHLAAILLFRMDPHTFLFPLIETWPTPSESAETLIVRRDGDDVLFLNELRHQPGSSLHLRIPLTQTDVPAVQAVSGYTGIFEGLDYRGIKVVSDVIPIPGSPWYMIAKVDRKELLAELNSRGIGVLIFVLLAIGLAGIFTGLLYNHHQRSLYEGLYQAETTARQSDLRFRSIFDSAPVSIWDEDWTEVIEIVRPLRERGIEDFTVWFNDHPEVVEKALSAVVINDVNQETLDMFDASSKEQMLASLQTVFSTPDTLPGFIGELAALAQGRTEYTTEMSLRRLDKSLIYVLLTMVFPQPGDDSGSVLVTLTDITERLQMEKELRQHRESLEELVEERSAEVKQANAYNRGLLEASLDALVTIGKDGTITDVNAATENIIGLKRDDLIGSDFADYFTDPDTAREGYKKTFKEGVVRDYELYLRHLSGHETPVRYNATVYRDESGEIAGVFAAARDMTDYKAAEKRIQENEERQRQILNNLPVGLILSTGLEQKMLYQNPRFVEFFGYTIEEFPEVSKWWPLAYPDPIYREKVAKEWNRRITEAIATESEIEPMEVNVASRDGEAKRMLVHAAVIGELNLVTFTDLSDLRRAEQATIELNKVLIRRTEELEAVNKELEAFSYSVSHDLKAPLRSVDGYAGFLEEDYADKLDDEGRRLLRVVRESAREMGQLINDLLAFSRLSRRDLNMSPLDMEELIQDVWEQTRLERDGRQIKLKVGDLPHCYGDRTTVREVLINLIGNAIKFTSCRDFAVIDISAHIEKDQVVYTVKDNGAGFDMTYKDKLFSVFQRLHTANEFEGTGIGLALVKRIVQRHGGRVFAEGKIDEGASITFTLPQKEKS